MEYRVHGFRHGDYLIENVDEYRPYWLEITEVLEAVSDERIAEHFAANYEGDKKSISPTINDLLKEEFVSRGWSSESPIFAEPDYMGEENKKGMYRLDFAKGVASIEVAFNHGNDAPWNLLKPTLASELNHVEKAIQTEIGVVIAATDAMKAAGGFDGAVGSYEKYLTLLRPMGMILTAPLVLIGLEPPRTFRIVHKKQGRRYLGYVEYL